MALGSVGDVDRAVAAATHALPEFAARSKAERIDLLERIIEVFTARQGELMAALTEEMGAPSSLTAQTGAGLAALRQAVETLKGYEFEARQGVNIIRHEAIGVAGLITPWNWPVQLACNKLASAFAAGCPVVLKPSEFTPVSAIVLADILHEAGVPKGVFNLVNGDGPTVGNAIAAHEDIAVVSFTGSTRAGTLVAQAAAPSVKRVAQELGGKSANLILPDADLKAAADYNVTRGFSNSGQSCHSPTRILVPEKGSRSCSATSRRVSRKRFVSATRPKLPPRTVRSSIAPSSIASRPISRPPSPKAGVWSAAGRDDPAASSAAIS